MTTSTPDSYQSSLSLRYKRNIHSSNPHPHPPAPILSTTSPNPSFVTSAWTSARSLNHSPGLQAVSPPAFLLLIWTLPPSCGIQGPSQCGPPPPDWFLTTPPNHPTGHRNHSPDSPRTSSSLMPSMPFSTPLSELLLIFQGPLTLGGLL